MTTRVTITSNDKSPNDVRVTIREGTAKTERILKGGESTEEYIYDNKDILVEEVPSEK